MAEKSRLRKQMKELKASFSPSRRLALSLPVIDGLEAHPVFRDARVVLLYWSLPDEVYTHDLVRRYYREKTVLLPCVRGEELELRRYTGDEAMCAGEGFGIGEPTGPLFSDLEAIDLIVVPGVAFDAAGHRLGRGKGYYDRILARTPSARTVGICFPFQVVAEVPTEPWDITIDFIIPAE